jgi:hypothetical protein
MGRFLLFFTIVSLIAAIFFFYIHISLLYGSLLLLLTVIFALSYAAISSVNKLSDNKKLDE